jgi:hypothetical protein
LLTQPTALAGVPAQQCVALGATESALLALGVAELVEKR